MQILNEESFGLQWGTFLIEDTQEVHIVPFNDLKEHELETTCCCNPTQDDEDEDI